MEDTYRRFDAAGDEHVGRVVTGLQMHIEEVALLLPTFVPMRTKEQEIIMECVCESMDVRKVNPRLHGHALLVLCTTFTHYKAPHYHATNCRPSRG